MGKAGLWFKRLWKRLRSFRFTKKRVLLVSAVLAAAALGFGVWRFLRPAGGALPAMADAVRTTRLEKTTLSESITVTGTRSKLNGGSPSQEARCPTEKDARSHLDAISSTDYSVHIGYIHTVQFAMHTIEHAEAKPDGASKERACDLPARGRTLQRATRMLRGRPSIRAPLRCRQPRGEYELEQERCWTSSSQTQATSPSTSRSPAS